MDLARGLLKDKCPTAEKSDYRLEDDKKFE